MTNTNGAVSLKPLGEAPAPRDVRESFLDKTKRAAGKPQPEAEFIHSRRHLLSTHPMRRRRRAELLDRFITERGGLDEIELPPTPGGVGYGFFYKLDFKTGFVSGTAISWEIICPNPPGGNVSDFLYLTATNRSALGVEALVSYHGQDEPFFSVFDWARPEQQRWQIRSAFSDLGNYLLPRTVGGFELTVLPLVNSTFQTSGDQWSNTVQLWDHTTSEWHLAYQFDYPSTTAEQSSADWVGSWGPIVETFEPSYSGTRPMGAFNTRLASRDAAATWSDWQPLIPGQCDLRVDNKGFDVIFIDPNFSWDVQS